MPDPRQIHPTATEFYESLTGDEDARACRDIPDEACVEQPRNFFVHLFAFTATKIGDQLASARIVLPWLLAAVGAPVWVAGWLVPIREAGALLPQLAVAGPMRRTPVRKWFWVAGSLVQAGCLLAMLWVAVSLQGVTAGIALLVCLLLFSLARGVCSVASKDVLGKTIAKRRRGTLMGLAGSLSGVATLGMSIWLILGQPRAWGTGEYGLLLAGAALLWLCAALVFAGLRESAGAVSGGSNALQTAIHGLRILRSDSNFRNFLITRALLISTSLGIPFFVLMINRQAGNGADLGIMLLAGGLATMLSSRLWGRWADRDSRKVMMVAGGLSAILLFTVSVISVLYQNLLQHGLISGLLIFLFYAIHAGARLGRKTYLVDMATEKDRILYVALSNTLIGFVILATGLLGLLAQLANTTWVFLVLGCFSSLAIFTAYQLTKLKE